MSEGCKQKEEGGDLCSLVIQLSVKVVKLEAENKKLKLFITGVHDDILYPLKQASPDLRVFIDEYKQATVELLEQGE